MQLLDDDMDELFRNAASRYPLKTDGADWDALSRRLHPENEAVPPPPVDTPAPPRKTRWWRGLGLLALLLAGGIYWVTTQMAPAKNEHITATDTRSHIATSNSSTAATGNEPGNSVQQHGVAADRENKGDNAPAVNASIVHSPATPAAAAIADRTVTPAANTGVTNGNGNTKKDNGNEHTKTGRIVSPAARASLHPVRSVAKSWMIGVHTATAGSSPDNWSINPVPVRVPAPVADASVAEGVPAAPVNADSIHTVTAPVAISAVSGKTLAFNPAPDGISRTTDSLPVHAFKGAGIKVPTGFYAGIVVAPDFSTVKMQQARSLGYSFGAVVGYRISQHWAVETGAAWERKNYYSKGQYFDKSKLKNPDINILTVDGYCQMVDVPVNVRYYFNITQKHSWYANAGLSSYFMSREWYKYDIENNGAYYDRAVGYNTATQNWFSVLNLGVGYEHKVGGIGNVRIEPYVKVPLAGGIGIGSLPVTSVGINIGITRNIRW